MKLTITGKKPQPSLAHYCMLNAASLNHHCKKLLGSSDYLTPECCCEQKWSNLTTEATAANNCLVRPLAAGDV